MTVKVDIKSLLKKGLTGKEAGRLILQDNWEADHRRESFISDRELSAIKAGLKSSRDIVEYNSYVQTYRILDYTLKDANILTLELRIKIGAITDLVLYYYTDYSSELEKLTKPVIMTEKEYEDLKASSREKALQELQDMREVLEDRLGEVAPEGVDIYGYEDGQDMYEWVQKTYPDIWREAVSDILELVRSGKLRPVVFTGKEKEDLDKIWTDIRSLQAQEPINRLTKEEIVDWPIHKLYDRKLTEKIKQVRAQEEELLRAYYKAGRKAYSQKSKESLVKSLQSLLDGTISQEDQDSLLSFSYVTTQDLYKLGLPEWIEYVDIDSQDDLVTEFGDDIGLRGIAIIKDPKDSQIDKRGHFIRGRDRLELKGISEEIETKNLIRTAISEVEEKAKMVLAFYAVAELASEALGVDFLEDIRLWLEDLKTDIDRYNRARLDIVYIHSVPDSIKEQLKPINLEKLKPYTRTINELKARMALSLGDNWWEDSKKILLKDLLEKEAEDGQD